MRDQVLSYKLDNCSRAEARVRNSNGQAHMPCRGKPEKGGGQGESGAERERRYIRSQGN